MDSGYNGAQSVVSYIADTRGREFERAPILFVEIDHDIFSIVIRLFSLIREGMLSEKACAQRTA